MAIERVEIKDFLVFKGEFSTDFCPGVNVIIGGNGTGKTTLLKSLYYGADRFSKPANFPSPFQNFFGIYKDYSTALYGKSEEERISNIKEKHGIVMLTAENEKFKYSFSFFEQPDTHSISLTSVYIPEKDILEHSKGLLTFIEEKQTGFSQIYKNVLVKAQDIPANKQSEMQKAVGQKISDIIGGEVAWDRNDGLFYTIKTDGTRIPFASEASGYKKLGFLGLLVACGQLEKGSILFWDEPENSLNPELIPMLTDILLELQRGGVQIFVATHSYDVARWFELNKKSENELRYFNLRKESDNIVADVASEYISLENNPIDAADNKLFKRVVEFSAERSGVKRR